MINSKLDILDSKIDSAEVKLRSNKIDNEVVENEGIQGKALKGFERIRKRLAETSFKTWIEPMSDIKITEDVFYAKVKDDFHKGILEARYAKEIKMAFGVKEVILTI